MEGTLTQQRRVSEEGFRCLARITLREFRSQLYALALTSGERGGGLSQLDIDRKSVV